MPGSRPGAVIASTWAAMMYFGESGMAAFFCVNFLITVFFFFLSVKTLSSVPGVAQTD